MLAKAQLSDEFHTWNQRWGSPLGRFRVLRLLLNNIEGLKKSSLIQRVQGPFGFQINSSTRAHEFPWTYFELSKGNRVTLLEIGGALSGLQFVLARDGHEVHNVDPFFDYGLGAYEIDPVREHAALNRTFGTDVVLHKTTLPGAALGRHFDAVYCVSTIEHMGLADIEATLRSAKDVLVPGGLLVLTVDLFLDVVPFTQEITNRWGSNVSIAWMQELLGFEMVAGDRSELYGYPEFSSRKVLENLPAYAINSGYPQLAQLVCFRSPLA